MTTIALLLLAGVILLGFEVFVPGGVLGVLGALALVGGVVTAFVQLGSGAGMITFAIAAVLVGTMLYLEFAVLPKTAWGKRLFLRAVVTGTSQDVPAAIDGVVGRDAEALTTLAPSGYVMIGGRRYEAFCRSGHAGKGTMLRVVGVDNFRVIVTKLQLP